MRKFLILWIMAGIFSTGSLLTSSAAHATKPSPKNTKKIIKLSKKTLIALKYAKAHLYQQLRVTLRDQCYSSKPDIKPVADLKGQLSLLSRERRIVALQLKMRRLDGYLDLLQRAHKSNIQEKKIMEIGYIVSDGMLSLSSLLATKFLGQAPWISVLLPVSLKVAAKALSTDTSNVHKPSTLQVQVDKEMDRVIQVIQFQKNPGPYSGVVCYLTSSHLKTTSGQRCSPDHPFIINQYKMIRQLWDKSQRQLKSSYSWWLAPAVEFLTKHELKVIQNEKNFIILLSGALRVQKQFLKKMLEVLKNDYKAHGCKQMGPIHKS